MMKKYKLLLLLGLSFSLTGCGVVTLTDQENNGIAEYIAGTLLKYDRKYETNLVEQEELEEMDTQIDSAPTPTPNSDPNSNNTNKDSSKSGNDKAVNYKDLKSVYASNIDVIYDGYELCESYPKDASELGYMVDAPLGEKLLVIQFAVKNLKGEEQRVNLLSKNISYQLDMDLDTIYKPLFTGLENDLQYLDVTIPAKGSTDAVLIFQVKDKKKIKNLNVLVTNNDKTAIIKMK